MPTALEECKDTAKRRLESMIEHLYRQIRNLERFEDDRMLVATADVKYHWDQVNESAEALEDAFNAAKDESEEDSLTA